MVRKTKQRKPKQHKEILARHPSMSGFGDKLRREREMRGISLEEISASTKIGTRSLRAIEEEDFEKLPGGIFNKGFVRAYSRFLGLDEEETVADFDAAWNEYEAAKRPKPQVLTEELQPERSKSGWMLVVVLIILSAIGAGWYKVQRSRDAAAVTAPAPVENPQPSSPVPQNSAAPSNSATEPKPAQGAAPTPTESTQKSASTQQSGSTQEASANFDNSPVSSVDQKKQNATSPNSAVVPQPASAPIRLQVFAREDSWLSVSADGKNLGEGILSAQKTRSIHAQKEVRLKVGNLAGVQVSFNGASVDVDGQPKQVKELIFTINGLQQ